MWGLGLFMLVALASGKDGERPVVITKEGPVKGTQALSADGRVFYSFKGLPYASPPLRLQPPRRHPGWTEVRDASEHGEVCLQYDVIWSMKGTFGSEDCLFANVYSPQLPRSGADPIGGLPVMVWIHGGGFTLGSGNDYFYGPDYLVDADVVLVTFNYRLGSLGFFTTEDAVAGGNYGMLDQVLLLEWVRDNAVHFGGNPQMVTIFGVSYGGASVSLLMLSPLAKGLFHHAISQSGSASGFAVPSEGNNMASRYAEHLNCSATTSVGLKECFLTASLEDIGKANAKSGMKLKFPIRVDCERENPFLPEDPNILLGTGSFSHVPLMIGQMAMESALFAPMLLGIPPLKQKLDSKDLPTWAAALEFTPTSDAASFDNGVDVIQETNSILNFYLGNATANITQNLESIIEMMSDRSFTAHIIEDTRQMAQHTAVYSYVFDHTGPGRLSQSPFTLASPHFNTSGIEQQLFELGPKHGDDVMYIFHQNLRNATVYGKNTAEGHMIRAVVELWSHFARTGYPASQLLAMPNWPIFTETDQRYMTINDAPTVGHHAFRKRIQFWRTVPLYESWKHPLERSCVAPTYKTTEEP